MARIAFTVARTQLHQPIAMLCTTRVGDAWLVLRCPPRPAVAQSTTIIHSLAACRASRQKRWSGCLPLLSAIWTARGHTSPQSETFFAPRSTQVMKRSTVLAWGSRVVDITVLFLICSLCTIEPVWVAKDAHGVSALYSERN